MNFSKVTACLDIFRKRASISRVSLTMAMASMLTVADVSSPAQTAPSYPVTTATTLPTPSGFGGPNGNPATDEFGDLLCPMRLVRSCCRQRAITISRRHRV